MDWEEFPHEESMFTSVYGAGIADDSRDQRAVVDFEETGDGHLSLFGLGIAGRSFSLRCSLIPQFENPLHFIILFFQSSFGHIGRMIKIDGRAYAVLQKK